MLLFSTYEYDFPIELHRDESRDDDRPYTLVYGQSVKKDLDEKTAFAKLQGALHHVIELTGKLD